MKKYSARHFLHQQFFASHSAQTLRKGNCLLNGLKVKSSIFESMIQKAYNSLKIFLDGKFQGRNGMQ